MASRSTAVHSPARRPRLIKLALASLGLILLALSLNPFGTGADKGEFEEFVVFDSEGRASNTSLSASESSSYQHFNPVIDWRSSNQPVEFVVSGAPFPEATEAVMRAVNTVDRRVKTRWFVRHDGTQQINPCTHESSSIGWLPGDGPGKGLAFAGVCYNTKTREIAGFRVIVDSLEEWSKTGEPGKFDVESVLAHEMGHVAGLDHVVGDENALLTMYPYTAYEETHKRTLGKGDRRGLYALYDEEAEDEDDETDGGGNWTGADGTNAPHYAETGGGNSVWD